MNLEREDDQLLVERAAAVRLVLEGGDIAQIRQKISEAFSESSETRLHVRLIDASGNKRIETPRMNAILPETLFQSPGSGVNHQASGTSYRLLALPVKLTTRETGVLQIAMDRSEEVEVLFEPISEISG